MSGGMTPGQIAQITCLLAQDGTVVAQTFATGGQSSAAAKAQNLTPVLCDSATQIGTILSTK
jgi:hypothetical protein